MSSAPNPSLVLSFEEARQIVEEHATGLRPRGRELLSLLAATGRVLAEPVHADRDIPPFPRATRDGYAVRSTDLLKLPADLNLVGEIRAGAPLSDIRLQPGQAVAIMTGAPVPDGADAVVMIEHTTLSGKHVRITKSAGTGADIVGVGTEAKRGELLLLPGTRLDYAAIAVVASVGRSRLIVHAKPKVAVLATGDEIVDIDVPPGPHQIRNSNSYSLAAQIQNAGGDALLMPIAPDEPVRLRQLLAEALECDLVLIAGGVSLGKYDLVEQELTALRAEFFFNGARIQPGKPIVFGRVPSNREDISDGEKPANGWKYFFGLPGNPVSTMVTFELFARPMLDALCGAAPRRLVFMRAKLRTIVTKKTGLKRFLPALLSGEFENPEVELAPWQGSGDIASVARANCFLVVPPDRERIEAGEWVSILLR
jgi:molybdopterin molybdotransferase